MAKKLIHARPEDIVSLHHARAPQSVNQKQHWRQSAPLLLIRNVATQEADKCSSYAGSESNADALLTLTKCRSI
jgi:hypothetical protein